MVLGMNPGLCAYRQALPAELHSLSWPETCVQPNCVSLPQKAVEKVLAGAEGQ